MTPETRRAIRYGVYAVLAIAVTAGVVAWRVYPNEVAAWWARVNERPVPPYTPEERQAILVEWLGGEAAVDELRAATSARAFRWSKGRMKAPVDEPVKLSAEQLRRLIEFITDHTVYSIGRANRNAPIPADNATTRGVTIEIETSTSTREITMWYPDIGRRIFFDDDGERRYFRPERMIPLLRELFPGEDEWVLP